MQRNHHQTLNEFLAARKGIFLGGAYTTIPSIMETTASNPCIMVKGSRKKGYSTFCHESVKTRPRGLDKKNTGTILCSRPSAGVKEWKTGPQVCAYQRENTVTFTGPEVSCTSLPP